VLQVRLGFGSIDDPSGREGLALLVARLLASHPALASLSALGAQLTATAIDSPITFSNREYFDLSVRFLSEDWQAVVKQVAQALRVGSFGAEAIERARAKLLDEMEGFQNDATWVAEAGAVARLMPGWHPPFGTRASIKRITPVDVNEFLARHTRGGEVWVGLVAPAEPARQLAALAEAFGPFSSGTARSTAKSDQEWFAGEERVPLEGKTQAEVVAALPGVARDHPDYLPLRLLNYILGETGYAGRLGKALVDPGLSYSVYAVPEFSRLPGPLLIRTATGTANLAATLDTIRSVLSDLRPLTAGEDEGEGRRGIEEWELREAQAYVLGRMVLGLESQEALARTLVEAEYFGQDLLDFPKRSGEVLSVTQQQLNEVARRTYRPERLSLAVAGAVPKAPQ
jgi:zinc protease